MSPTTPQTDNAIFEFSSRKFSTFFLPPFLISFFARLFSFTVIFFAAICMLLLLSLNVGWGQVNISVGNTITQNFDASFGTSSLTWTNNTTLPGWYISSASPLATSTGTTTSGACLNLGVAGTNANTDRALGCLQSGGTAQRFGIRILNNGSSSITSFSISFTGEQWRSFNTGTLVFEYQTGSTITSLTAGTWTPATALDFTSLQTSAGTALDGNAPANRSSITATLTVTVPVNNEIFFRWTRNTNSSPILAIDDLSITANGASSSPTLNAVTLGTALSTTYGTASAGVSFSAAGANLTGNITATAQSGYEVSTSSGSGYGSSVSVASGTLVYVRFAATKSAGTYNGVTAVVLSSSGAIDANVTTSASSNTVNTKALTITGLSASDKQYDATTSVTVSGAPTYSGLANSESFSVSSTPTWVFSTKTAGTNKTINQTGSYAAPSANYTVTQPTLTATITVKALTVTSAAASNKTYDGTTTATVTGTLLGVIAGDAVTLTGTGTFASANVGTGIAVTSTSTLAGADNANYILTQPTGLSANITQASQTIVFGALPAKTTADVPFACGATSATSGTNALTYTSSNTAVATINASGTITIVGAGTTTITVSQAGSANYAAAADVSQTLTVTQGPCGSETFAGICTSSCSPASSSYGTRTWTGVNGVSWSASDARTDQTITSNAITIRNGSLTFGVSVGQQSSGIGDLTLSAKAPFSDVGTLQLSVNGNIISSITTTGSTPSSVVSYTWTGINQTNISSIVIAQTTSGSRITIDDISWTCYTPSTVPQAVSTSAASSIVNTTAVLNGNLTTVGVLPNTIEKGFVYAATATNGTPQVGGTGVTKTSVAGISTGAYTLSLSGLSANTGYSFRAYAYDGTTYTYGSVLTFTTLTVASKLGFGTAPPANGSLSTNLTTFTVQALRSDNTLDTEFSGSITVAKATGPGNISGTLTVSASAGVATFSSVQFDALGDYTIIASSGALTNVTSSTITIVAYAVGDYRSRASGYWSSNTTWEKWDGSGWVACSSGDVPNVSTASVTIQNGHTVDTDGAGTGPDGPWTLKNLTVDAGGKVWDNYLSTGPTTYYNTYLQMYGNITCNGTIGETTGDDISFDIAGGTTCTISGTGTFTAARLRKDNTLSNSFNTTVVVDMNINLTWSSASGTVMYNDAGASSNFDVTVNSGKTIKCYGPGAVACNVAIDGTNGGDSSPLGGTYTIYGTLDIDGAYYSLNNNTAASARSTSLVIKNGGTVKCRYIETGSSGAAGNTLSIENGGKLMIFGSVDTITASMNNTTWNAYSATNNTWDFQSGSTIEYSGATQQKIHGITSCSNFTVSGGGLKVLGNDFTVSGMLTLTNGRIQTDAYKLIHTSTSAADLTHTTGSSSFIYGIYRRYIASNTSSYEMPVGLSSSTSGYRRADLVNNGLAGLSYIDASVRSVAESGNNVDSRITCTQEGTTLTDVIGNTVWSLVPNSSPSGGTYGVRLYVNGTGLTAADDNTFCAVKRNDGSTDYADWNTFFATTTIPSNNAAGRIYNSGNGYAERLGYDSFSEHTIGKSPSNQPLPVGLTSFEVSCEEGAVMVKWTTASESNSSYFNIERSIDGSGWLVAGVVTAAGNSMESLSYEFKDRIDTGIAYYRLVQVDMDGQETEFNPVSVICNSKEVELVTLPNPSGKEFTIMFSSSSGDEEVKIQISDAHGKSLLTKYVNVTEGENLISISDFLGASGTYFVKVTEPDGSVKMVRHQIF